MTLRIEQVGSNNKQRVRGRAVAVAVAVAIKSGTSTRILWQRRDKAASPKGNEGALAMLLREAESKEEKAQQQKKRSGGTMACTQAGEWRSPFNFT